MCSILIWLFILLGNEMYATSFELNLMIMFLYHTNMVYYNLSDWIVCYHIQRHFFLLFHHSTLHSLSILASSGSNSDSASSSPRDMRALPKKLSSSLCQERWFLYIMMLEMVSGLSWLHMMVMTWPDKLKTCSTPAPVAGTANVSQTMWLNWGYRCPFTRHQLRTKIL